MKSLVLSGIIGLLSLDLALGQATEKIEIPSIYSNMMHDKDGKLYIDVNGEKAYEKIEKPFFTLQQAQGTVTGIPLGLFLDFQNPDLNGTLYYGFIPYGDSKHPLPVYFRSSEKVVTGRATIKIKLMGGKYDMIGWEERGQGIIGYRLINDEGKMIYDGRICFEGKGPFKVDETIVEGPFVNKVTPEGATISFTTNRETKGMVTVDGKTFEGEDGQTQHEIDITGLKPGTKYGYKVEYGGIPLEFEFKTAPTPGSRKPFTFAYASDSRNGNGGGERSIYGANAYIMKKIMALGTQNDMAFLQFSGDLINGYLTNPNEMDLQYANWKRSVEPFWHHLPIYVSMGNHEALMRVFSRPDNKGNFLVDRFPFDTESGEAVFNRNFVNPENGPESEDGAAYDPNSRKTDFPSYKENVFYYTYDNVAVIVLNSNYLYSPSHMAIPHTSGGLHAYIMSMQLKWLENTIKDLEKDENIDHIFVTQHTPMFPNGGHVSDDMWYNGDNSYRPYINGKPLAYGIIQRRDQLLNTLVNKSTKVIAVLTGDEHNYARTEISPEMQRYNEDYEPKRIRLKRTIYQINNGAAGAPYYAQEQTPWTPFVSGFTTQNALVLFHVDGKKVTMEVVNPDTLEKFDSLEMR
ncbi:metallophosphoesterase [Flammeovirgaceae bacterium SG7u.111]|nr:metallophosphoesterase [Flammeovirgaceae bacterium SG7u.132]WPO38345.1 metallophosphoesterase [Flammeovirgaceae bacterium SG7u.111]